MADPAKKSLEILSSILALLLEDQPGEAMAALEAVRRKARRDGVTGGALKQLVRQVGQIEISGHASAFPPDATSRTEPVRRALQEAREHLRQARRDNLRLQWQLRHATQPTRPSIPMKLGALERRLRHMDEIELTLQRRTLDLQALNEETNKERRRARLEIEAASRRRRRRHLLLAVMALLVGMAGDADKSLPPSGRAAGTPVRALPPAGWDATLAL